MKSIGKEMELFTRFKSWECVSPQVEAWITMKARKRGLSPDFVKAGIKARFTKMRNNRSRKVAK